MYDHVTVHGLVHQMRMEDVFWGRMRILTRALELIVAALPPPASQQRADNVLRAWRELIDTVYKGNKEQRQERDQRMMELLKRLAEKPLTLVQVEGEASVATEYRGG